MEIKKLNRIVLIYPGKMMKTVSVFPQSLLYLAEPLIRNDYNVEIFDCRLNDLSKLNKENITIIGITATSGIMLKYALEAARWCRKELKNCYIVWGGVHVSLTDEVCIRNPLFDIIVRGEGEKTFLELCNAIINNEDWQSVKGITFLKNGKVFRNKENELVDLNEAGLLPFWLLDLDKYNLIEGRLCTSRGCPFRCGFCYNKVMNNSLYRYRKSEKVLEDIENIIKMFGVVNFKFDDDNFFVSQERTKNICEGIIKKDWKINWDASCRLDYVMAFTPEFKSLLNKSGCYKLSVGVESGSTRMLNFIKKDLDLSEVLKSTNKAENVPIKLKTNFVLGFPEEREKDVLQILDIIDDRLKKTGFRCQIMMFIPWPGTPLYDYCLSVGLKPIKSVEKWADIKLGNAYHLNFHKKSYQRFIQTVFYINLFLYKYPTQLIVSRYEIVKSIKKIMLDLLIIFGKIRWKTRFFRFNFAWQLLHKYLSTRYDDIYYDLYSREERKN